MHVCLTHAHVHALPSPLTPFSPAPLSPLSQHCNKTGLCCSFARRRLLPPTVLNGACAAGDSDGDGAAGEGNGSGLFRAPPPPPPPPPHGSQAGAARHEAPATRLWSVDVPLGAGSTGFLGANLRPSIEGNASEGASSEGRVGWQSPSQALRGQVARAARACDGDRASGKTRVV